MADPRANVRFNDILAKFVTYKIDNSTIVYTEADDRGAVAAMLDKAVGLSADGTVQLVSDAEGVEGKLIEVFADNFATVQVAGYMTLPGGTSATLTRGASIVGDLLSAAKGYIRVSDGATAAEIIAQRGQIIENGTTTAVVVRL